MRFQLETRPSVSVPVMAADAGAGKSRARPGPYKSLTRRKKENTDHMGLGWSGLDLLDNKM